MTEKRFKVHAEEYQDTDDMGYAIAPPVTYYHVGNSEIGFNFDTEKEAEMLCEAWNKLVEENEVLKKENQQLKQTLNINLEEKKSDFKEIPDDWLSNGNDDLSDAFKNDEKAKKFSKYFKWR